MEFRTVVSPLAGSGLVIDHACECLLLGSCFSDEVGRRLQRDGFRVTVNPGGALYNPLSLQAWMERMASQVPFAEGEFVEGPDGRFHSWMHSTAFSRASLAEAVEVAQCSLREGAEALRRAAVVFLTLGSTRVFRLRAEGGRVVTNCHKHHPAEFAEERLSLDDTVAALRATVSAVAAVNPAAKVVWTVSPVRHPGQGGLHANMLSKSTLLLATDAVGGIYFPAFEALNDDLRDYRFYAADMRHPSDVGADYVYELLCRSFMSDATRARALECRRESLRRAHISLHCK
ncbi:MAG: GSCFA domain-containing protein [Bacteroides sp.]|nr:GSCFA domain-containing protein [Bacteroides sp.]